jgi:hypothetical protein
MDGHGSGGTNAPVPVWRWIHQGARPWPSRSWATLPKYCNVAPAPWDGKGAPRRRGRADCAPRAKFQLRNRASSCGRNGKLTARPSRRGRCVPFSGHDVGLSPTHGLVPHHPCGSCRLSHCACRLLKRLCGRLVFLGRLTANAAAAVARDQFCTDSFEPIAQVGQGLT